MGHSAKGDERGPIRALLAHGRGLLICVSFFNLSLIPVWSRSKYDYVEVLPYAKILGFTLASGALLYLLVVSTRRWHRRAWYELLGLVLLVVLPFDGLRKGFGLTATELGGRLDLEMGTPVIAVLMGVLVAGGLVILFRYREVWRRLCIGILLLLSPMVAFSAYLAVSRYGVTPSVAYEGAPPDKTRAARRVQLILLDEADYQYIFERRAPNIELPALDGLQRECLSFTQAYSPGSNTLLSVPAMLLEIPLKSVRYDGLNLGVRRPSGEYIPDWRAQQNLLSSLDAGGYSVEVVGNYHAYCGGHSQRYTHCSHIQMPVFFGWRFEHLPFLLALYKSNLVGTYVARDYLRRHPRNYGAEHRRIFEYVRSSAARPRQKVDFSMIHLSLPHLPSIDGSGNTESAYYDNLKHVDAFLRQWRESASRDGAALIVTSDHGLRADTRASAVVLNQIEGLSRRDRREELHVPFFVCVPDPAGPGSRVASPVSTIHIGKLSRELLEGSISSYADIASYYQSLPFNAGLMQPEMIIENLSK